jgi:hypothetical protein
VVKCGAGGKSDRWMERREVFLVPFRSRWTAILRGGRFPWLDQLLVQVAGGIFRRPESGIYIGMFFSRKIGL